MTPSSTALASTTKAPIPSARGWRRGRDWESRVYPDAAHEENAWAARLTEILVWLLRA